MSETAATTRFLFTAVPLQGHFWPCLCVAAALANNHGADVTFAAYEDKRAAMNAASPAIGFRALPPLPDALASDLARQLAAASDKRAIPRERRAPRVGSTVFPFYEEHMYAPLLQVAKDMVAEQRAATAAAAAAAAAAASVVVVCEHACLAAHDVAETLSLPLALLWQLPLQYALAMGVGPSGAPMLRDARVPVELPGAVLPARLTAWQRAVANPRLRRRQLRVLWDEYVPKRLAARERSGVAAQAEAAGGRATWAGVAPFAPATDALPRQVLHVVSGSPLLEPESARAHALPPGWSLSGPQGVDFSQGGGGDERPQQQQQQQQQKQPAHHHHHHHHHPAVAALLAEAELDAASRVVYVAFGTLAAFDDRATIEAMARAFVALAAAEQGGGGPSGGGGSPAASPPRRTYVVWSLPPAGQALLPRDLLDEEEEEGEGGETPRPRMHVVPSPGAPAPPRPPGVLVVPRAEQQRLLSHPSVALFVSHCGLNSAYEALARGVPLVGWALFADQHVNAQHARNEGVGVVVPDDGADGDGSGCAARGPGGTRRDARAIGAIVRGALADEGMRARARALGRRLRAARRSGADEAAATLLEAFAVSAREEEETRLTSLIA